MESHPLTYTAWCSMESYEDSTVFDTISEYLYLVFEILEENQIKFSISLNEMIEIYSKMLHEKLIKLDISYYILKYGYSTRYVKILSDDADNIIYNEKIDYYNHSLRGPCISPLVFSKTLSQPSINKYVISDPFFIEKKNNNKIKKKYRNKFLPLMVETSKYYRKIYGDIESNRSVEIWDDHVINHVKNPEKTLNTCIFCRDEHEYLIYKWKTEIDPVLFEMYYSYKMREDELGTPLVSVLDCDILSRFLFYNVKNKYILYDLDDDEIEEMPETQEYNDKNKNKKPDEIVEDDE